MTAPHTELVPVRPLAQKQAQNGHIGTPQPLSLRGYLANAGAIPVVIALAIFAIFVPALTAPYAFSDDYPVLYIANGLGSSPWFGTSVVKTVAASGRPLAGVADQLLFSAAGTIDNLWLVRLVGVTGIVLLALLVHWALVRSHVSLTVAAPIAVLVCTQPAFLVFGSWAVLFNVPYAAILGGIASLLTGSAARERRPAAGKLAGAVTVLLGAVFIYQSAAMFFWVFLAIALVGSRHDTARIARLLRLHLGVAGLALAVAYVSTKIIVRAVGTAAPNAARDALVHHVAGKAGWFLREPLYHALSLFELRPASWLALPVALVAIVGIQLALRREGLQSLRLLAVGALLIPLAFLPSLAVAENSPTYRVQVALTSLIALYASLGAVGIWLVVRDRFEGGALLRADRLALATGIAFVFVTCAVAARTVTKQMVEPQSTELRIMRSQLAAVRADAPVIGFVQLAWNRGYYTDELGLASAARPWTPEPAIDLILREEGRLPPRQSRPVISVIPWYTTTIPRTEPVINLRVLDQLR